MKKLKKPVRVITTVYSCYTNESATTNTVITVGVTVGAVSYTHLTLPTKIAV